MIMSHIEYNKHFSYSLDNCLKRISLAKNDEVMLYIKDHKCYTTYHVEGKKTKEKDLHFDRVPFAIMSKYGFDDVELTLQLYEHQFKYFFSEQGLDQKDLVCNNIQLVKAVYAMEREGIKVNLDYCKAGQEHALSKVNESIKCLDELTGKQFINGPKWLKEALGEQGIELEVSEKGNPILNKNKLKSIPNAVAFHVMEMRDMEKEATFYSTFPRFADQNGIVHPNYRLTGTDTGRFSCSDPNLQQVPKEAKASSDQPYTVRGAFEAGKDFIFVSIDYDQMEYRIMADYAGEMGMIEAIKGGLDPHTYVANMMGVDRTLAKTLNFGLLYGMGIGKLALALGTDDTNAKSLKQRYYSELPNVLRLTRQIQDVAIGRGYVKNGYGRRYYLDDPKWAYKMPNYLIQGTGADVVRHAIPRLDYQLEGMKSKMLLQIHDEFIFKIHTREVHVIPELKRIMEDEYKPMNGMNLTCGVDWSPTTWDTRTFKPWSEYIL
jgi:DNA polymerase-1